MRASRNAPSTRLAGGAIRALDDTSWTDGGRPLRGQLQQNLTLPGLVSLLSGTNAVLREPVEDTREVHRMLSQQHTSQ